jgi:hypothetical protein
VVLEAVLVEQLADIGRFVVGNTIEAEDQDGQGVLRRLCPEQPNVAPFQQEID